MTEAEITIAWPPLRVAVGCVASYFGRAEEDARLQIVRKAEAGWVRARGLTLEGDQVSLLPASWRGIDWNAGSLPSCEITNIKLCGDDLIAADLLSGRSEGRKGWWAAQTLVWIIRRELGEWTPEMGREIKPAQLKLSEAIAARRINLWGRQPRSSQFEQIPTELFSLSKYKVVVTFHGDLSTEPPRKRHDFEKEYERECGWHDIIFDEDEIRREWLPAGRAAPAYELAEVAEESMPEPEPPPEPELTKAEPEPVSDGEPEPAAPVSPTPEPSKPEKLPVWLKTVNSHFAVKVRRKGPYDSLASLRRDIEKLLEKKRKGAPQDRTIERGLIKHRPEWFINRGRKGDAS